MSCAETLRTQAYLDGELDNAAAAEAEQHIATCAECQALSADTAHLSDAIRLEATRHRAPNELQQRIRRRLVEEPAPPVARTPNARRSFWFGAAGGTGLTAAAAGLAALMLMPPSAATFTGSVVDAYTGALSDGRSIAVVSSNHHTVKPWFAGRVAVSPPVQDFVKQGFPLLGGRVDAVTGAPAAVVVYGHGRHRIDLFVWADAAATLPADGTRHGYRAVFWKKADLDFAAVSDVDPGELKKFVALVRAEPE